MVIIGGLSGAYSVVDGKLLHYMSSLKGAFIWLNLKMI